MTSFTPLLLLALSAFVSNCHGFQSISLNHSKKAAATTMMANSGGGHDDRRAFLSSLVFVATTTALVSPSCAAESQPMLFLTGKTPRPANTPAPASKSSDTKGTRKDPTFLRSISDCKAQCEQSGYGQLAMSKDDCLQACQDICCQTYEQCTFSIVRQ